MPKSSRRCCAMAAATSASSSIRPRPDADGTDYAERNNSKLRALFAKRARRLRQGRSCSRPAAPRPCSARPESADVVLTFRNAHNWVMDGNEKAMFKAMFDVLKPGGTLGVVDHRAKPDQPAAEMKRAATCPRPTSSRWPKRRRLQAAGQERDQRQPARHQGLSGRRLDPAAAPGQGRRGSRQVPGHRRKRPHDACASPSPPSPDPRA